MNRIATLALLLTALLAPEVARPQVVDVSFLYKLSSTTGVIPFHGMSIEYDSYARELMVFGGGRVSLFNQSGMEVFTFGEDVELGAFIAAAPTASGDYVLLAPREDRTEVLVTNFRGEFKQRVIPSGLPPEFAAQFQPNFIGWAKDHIYLAELGRMRLVVLAMDGTLVKFHDLAVLCEVGDKREDFGIRGFRVTPNGDVLFTVQALFKAFVLSADGKFQSFGQRGGAPGKFNVVTGIARDERGFYYVADILKSAVLVFDKDFRWVKEFGYRGGRPGNIFAPVDVAVGAGKVYVSQFARRGVSVFEIKVADAP